MEAVAELNLSRRKLKGLVNNTAKSAEAINLVYVSDTERGIARVKKGERFVYRLDGKMVVDADVLARIKSLVIPPAWEKVWICTKDNGHLQATGVDVRGRKQYKYHPHWTKIRNHTKFYHLYEFGKALPAIRDRLVKDLSISGLPLQKVLAVIVSVMQETGIRIGNGAYEIMYGSYGLSTLKDEHVKIKDGEVRFSFRGKKGVAQDLKLKSKRLARLVKQCRDIPGKELFQYYDADGHRRSIDSGMVNTYIKEISGGQFTAKDFRTWIGTVHALLAFKELGCANTAAEAKQRIVSALDAVSVQLGNTRTVCRKYYVHPALLDLYECRALERYLKELEKSPATGVASRLHYEEQVLMKILEKA
jgi:DNA topoisomerase-1